MADLYLENLTKTFGRTLAVKNVTMKVRSGKLACLLGPSGCGKTTTLNMVAGIVSPTSGDIYIGDVRVTDLPPQQRKLGMVFQNYAIFTHMTVFDNIAYGLRIRKVPEDQIRREVKEVASFLRIENVLYTKGGKLRLDEMQRTAIGRSLLTKPAVFLMDEPLSNLDAALRTVMRVELKRIQREMKQTVLYVTHDQLEAMTIADEIAVMSMGTLEQYGTPKEVYHKPKSRFVAGFIGSPPMNFLGCSFVEGDGEAYLDLGPLKLNVSKYRSQIKKQATTSELTLGFRPEDIKIKTEKTSKEDLETTVMLVEPLGAEKIVNLKFGDLILRAIVPVTRMFRPGDKVWVEFEKEKTHIIDGRTDAVII